MFDALSRAAASCVQGAMTVLIILIAFGMILGGKRGGMWVIKTAVAPIKKALQWKLTALIYLCMFVILSYYVGSKIAHSLGF